jgi:hypothetical protein
MTPYAARIRRLRELTGKSVDDMAAAVGMEYMEYLDLELHDDELVIAPSLACVRKLATTLGVSAYALLSEAGAGVPTRRVSYADLVERVRTYLRDNNISREDFEDRVGWTLDDFFASEEHMLTEYNVGFLQDLCAVLDVYWMDALP